MRLTDTALKGLGVESELHRNVIIAKIAYEAARGLENRKSAIKKSK